MIYCLYGMYIRIKKLNSVVVINRLRCVRLRCVLLSELVLDGLLNVGSKMERIEEDVLLQEVLPLEGVKVCVEKVKSEELDQVHRNKPHDRPEPNDQHPSPSHASKTTSLAWIAAESLSSNDRVDYLREYESAQQEVTGMWLRPPKSLRAKYEDRGHTSDRDVEENHGSEFVVVKLADSEGSVKEVRIVGDGKQRNSASDEISSHNHGEQEQMRQPPLIGRLTSKYSILRNSKHGAIVTDSENNNKHSGKVEVPSNGQNEEDKHNSESDRDGIQSIVSHSLENNSTSNDGIRND